MNQEHVIHLNICEIKWLILKPEQLYKFHINHACQDCLNYDNTTDQTNSSSKDKSSSQE